MPTPRVLRRDPVEPPLQEQAAWREWPLTVELNGRRASQGGLFVEPPGGGPLAAQLALLEAWRIRTDPVRIITFEGEPYYPLDAIPGARFTFDRQALHLVLEVPADQFLPSVLAGEPVPRPEPVAGIGGWLDYDLLYQAGEKVLDGASGLVELGAFGPPGTLLSSFRLDDVTKHPEVIRLDTTFTRDRPGSRTSFRLGDAVAAGGALAPPVRFGGLQYATNFGVDPSFVTFPLPAIGGLARQDSVVDVLIDNLQRQIRSVPPGPFTIESLPVVTGAGEVQLRVTDLLGREQVVTQPYYVSSRLLKAGLHDFSYEVGALRHDYGRASFDYGDAIAMATHRYGFTDRLTGEAHAELQLDQQSLAFGGSWLLGRFGVVSGGIGTSTGGDGSGVLGELGYEYDGRRFNVGARTRWTSSGFRQAGADEEAARTDQLNLGLDLGAAGSLGLLLLHRDGRDGGDATSLAATWSLPLGPGALTLRAAQLVEPGPELALTAVYTLPLGQHRSASAELVKQGEAYRARSQFRQTRGASDLGLDYRLAAETGTDRSAIDARFSYQSQLGAAELDLVRFDGSNALRAGVNGSMALIDGELLPSRRIGRAFGLVSLPGFPDVRVYLDNRETGRTDARGRLLLPDLRPYEANRVRLDVHDLPLDAEIDTAEVEAVPYERSGMTIGFPVARSPQATVVLRAADGTPLPVGLRLRSADGRVTAWVARDGFTQVKGPLPTPVTVTSADGQEAFACELPAAPADDVLPDLGEVACR
ncbi:fimbria/pilus outer membrane usher protein [Benzoatithermus flavus]|uniref:Fimbria/pilus outer membrane usher protein n=1 Tax=Benzoatithermus flavus TaxID=3108223 RepID=A0ABU8XPM4_9PROT